MNLSGPFIRRPIATILLTIGLALAGVAGFFVLPVAPLPMVDFPAVSVSANLPGASPETMASSVATPLERRLGTIAGVNEITSQSSTGSTRISMQFDISKNVDSAARQVQAGINAARADLPATLRSNPTYRKANPAAAPVVILALTSDSKTPGQIYDAVNNIVQQRLSQVSGVGDVEIGGGSQPAVRVEISPFALNRFGVSLEDVRAAIQSANANRPKGTVQDHGGQRFQIYTSTGGTKAADYQGLIIAYRNNAPIRLSDVAEVIDGVQDARTIGLFNGKPAIVVLITQQPNANVIATVDKVRATLPLLQAQLPSDVKLQVASDSTTSIRASLREIEITLAIAIALVVLVVSLFLRSISATLIPAVATVVSLLGTFGAMYMLGFSLNNISLMALTVASGFVVDDAIVVLENTNRHIEAGMDRFEAALAGARQVGFTVVSMSISLVAAFIPLLFMGGQVGRLFREFSMTLSAAVLISLLVSLTTTPMMCAYLLPTREDRARQGRVARVLERAVNGLHKGYERSLDFALSARPLMMLILAAVIGLNVFLYMAIPKGFFPIQDSGRLNGGLRADQSISSEAMGLKMKQLVAIILKDPAVATVVGFTGGGRSGGGFLSVDLKPRGQRTDGGQAVITRLRPQLQKVTGITVFLNPQQDMRAGGRQSNATYQYTLKADNAADLKVWAQKLNDSMSEKTVMTDVNTDQQDNGVEAYVDVDHDTASRLGVNLRDVDNALYDSFGQRQVANIYEDLNQYTV
ncbi:MAG TPA: efflux RND transporter permease subunit, partial [Phenylobacterium sp.]|nr:efflux RND transporter permease subunit [Phenylobacterium sp.]